MVQIELKGGHPRRPSSLREASDQLVFKQPSLLSKIHLAVPARRFPFGVCEIDEGDRAGR